MECFTSIYRANTVLKCIVNFHLRKLSVESATSDCLRRPCYTMHDRILGSNTFIIGPRISFQNRIN